MKLESIIKISGISGIFLPIVFILGLILSILEAPWFRWTDNAISDLGRPEFGVPLFNYTLIAIGFLLFLFSIGLYYSLKREKMGPTALALKFILIYLDCFLLHFPLVFLY